MKIYTKTGDSGDTALFGGARVSKAATRVDVYGEVDELNSVLGLARSHGLCESSDRLLTQIQSALFNLGAELATAPEARVETGVSQVASADIEVLEAAIDATDGELPALKTFILPGGTLGASALHLARTVCRRAERRLVALRAEESVRGECVVYLNRLSDLLFTLARLENHRAGRADVAWQGARAQSS